VCDAINPVVNPIPRLIIVAIYARQYIWDVKAIWERRWKEIKI
jgi:hypothetical protein